MSFDRDILPYTVVRARRLHGVVALALALPGTLAVLFFRRDLVVEFGIPLWTIMGIVLCVVAAWSVVRSIRPEALLIASPNGIAVPHLLRLPIPWSDIRKIETLTHHVGRDAADRLIVHLKQPMELAWRPRALKKTFAGLPQSAVAIDLGLRWPLSADALRRQLRDAAKDFAVKSVPQSDAQSMRAPRWPAVVAVCAAALIAPALHVADLGPKRFFSEALALYARGEMQAALPLLQRDARAGDDDAAVALGTLYLNGDGVERNPAMAAGWFGRAAEAGNAIAAYHMGNAYRLGLGMPADVPTAIRWYEVAAGNGHAEAAFTLSRLYRLGDGVRRDYSQALAWLERAIDDDFAPAMHDLGKLYHEGLGVARDLNRAQEWYLAAAEQGLIAARYDLARLLMDGAPDQRSDGLKFLAEAAEYGYAPAQRRLAAVFAKGQGVEIAPIAAYKWITLAERAWPPATRADLVREKARIASRMNDADIAAAMEQVRTWRPLRSK